MFVSGWVPEISIIVPVFNVEKYLEACLDSILMQTFQDYEVILVDDGSTDSSGAICDEYQLRDNRVKAIHRQNGGLSAARNSGLDVAKGKWITFVDSDDAINEHYLLYLHQACIETGSQIACCSFSSLENQRAHSLDVDENTIYNSMLKKGSVSACSGLKAVEMLYCCRNTGIGISSCAKLYETRVWSNLRFPIGMINEDCFATPIALFKAEKVCIVDVCLYEYRIRDGSITHSGFTTRMFDGVQNTQKCSDYFEKAGEAGLAKVARQDCRKTTAVLSLQARNEKKYHEVPAECQMSIEHALRIIRKLDTDDYYSYILSQYYPWRVLPHAYWRKIKQILCLGL